MRWRKKAWQKFLGQYGDNQGYEAIYQDVNYEEHREELRYLYYYKGEMYYLLNNLISVVGADLDYDFYDLERNYDYVDDSMDRSISEDEMRVYADRLYEFLFNEQDGLLEEERDYYNNPQGKRELGLYLMWQILLD